YRVYANDSAGNMNVSETRVVTVAVPTSTSSPTHTAPMDSDGDGVLDGVEDNVPNGGDGNYDGVKDSMQDNVASIPSATEMGYITIETDKGYLRNVRSCTKEEFGILLSIWIGWF
ncbi:MAG: hypothetical protein DRP01_11200, partial [Archaeoglobales archaeon]